MAAAGREEFNTLVEELVLGPEHPARPIGACGLRRPPALRALRVGAELIRAATPAATVHMSDPTWGNHAPLLGSSGLKLGRYPTTMLPRTQCGSTPCCSSWNAPQRAMCADTRCCHNPTGRTCAGAWARWQS